jgi:hypothetical protein
MQGITGKKFALRGTITVKQEAEPRRFVCSFLCYQPRRYLSYELMWYSVLEEASLGANSPAVLPFTDEGATLNGPRHCFIPNALHCPSYFCKGSHF